MEFNVPELERSPAWMSSSPDRGTWGYLEWVSEMQVMGIGS